MQNGLVHIYTGDGKGKTTAAVGLGIRAAGHGLKVYMIQFLKTWDTGEERCIKKLGDDFKIFRFETKHGFINEMSKLEIEKLKKQIDSALEFACNCAKNALCDILILDEVLGALYNGLVDEDWLIDLISLKSDKVELVLTGRDAPKNIVDISDYVSDIKAIKHPYIKGIKARRGIEF